MNKLDKDKWRILNKEIVDDEYSLFVVYPDGCTYSKVGLGALAQAVERGQVWTKKYVNRNSRTTTYKFFYKYQFHEKELGK